MKFILCKMFATAGRCVDKPVDGLVTDLTYPQNLFSARRLLWQADISVHGKVQKMTNEDDTSKGLNSVFTK
ncbi:hypothetical protein CY34DRAFT_18869 [Suillus luteus UH-Slu-Lm8-n1]|uniref:Uncharacterized protein n=1 Tax=Suillus luteus UH-Slu-Lm8-n1 TaxID=930992 RepID=A0A0C9ZTM5_9AGAM|nr:hypothetical protein CY34DRAFT_18869 [Suillus luteus UH-Slu-Lm8-n1]